MQDMIDTYAYYLYDAHGGIGFYVLAAGVVAACLMMAPAPGRATVTGSMFTAAVALTVTSVTAGYRTGGQGTDDPAVMLALSGAALLYALVITALIMWVTGLGGARRGGPEETP